MKNIFSIAIAAIAVVCFSANFATADDTYKKKDQANGQHNNSHGAEFSKLDDATNGSQVRVSQLMGMNIQNAQGESVGEISDVVMDANTGKICYAAVTYGGLMGIGNKMHAVPLKAFKMKKNTDDKDDACLVLNVTQKQMEGETGFDESNWPSSADQTFTSNMNKRYGVSEHADHAAGHEKSATSHK